MGVPACLSSAEAITAAEQTLVAEVGPPLPDAVVWETPWYQGASVWYDHRNDVPAVLGWLEELPRRLGCVDVESDNLAPPSDGRSKIYRLTCHLDRNGRGYVISLQTMLTPTSASTTIVAYRERD